MDNLVYWIWLSLACTPGSVVFADLIKRFSSAEEIYNATDRQIRSSINPKISDCSSLYNKDLERAESIYNFCKTKGVGIVTYNDEDYPKLLKRIKNPPVLLYYRGRIPNWSDTFRCAVVGTRSLTSYGRKIAYNLAYDLAKLDCVVVSGMAKGIDSVAHVGALHAGGVTVAVLGSGIDVCYPSEHLTLAREIVKQGCVFTEYPPGTKPSRQNFPVRNRIISGLCDATVIVEADINSGAMITAHHAIDQKRQLFAVPTAIDLYGTSGTNSLIKHGARVCSGIIDIVNDFCVAGGFVLPKADRLENRTQTDFMQVLSKYKVVANTPDDDIYTPSGFNTKPVDTFLPPRTDAEIKAAASTENKPKTLPKTVDYYDEHQFTASHGLSGFSKEQMAIFKRIPPNGDCAIESLLLDGMSMNTLMRYLLKLEMQKFIVILPGDRVRRKVLT